ncbi:MAG: hypothetical protein ACO2Y5_00910 [Nitrosopumilaceae archaeon]
MGKAVIMIIVLVFLVSSPAYGHKLISHDDTHRSFETALAIPDHKISWAIYENLGMGEAKFYSFDAKQGDSFYASIVIPKISGLEEYSPTLILVNPQTMENDKVSFENQASAEKFLYEGTFPGKEFYEPFGQVTYWERQEVKTTIPSDGQYHIVIVDEKNQAGKYSLAIGTIEDFSGGDFFTILPKAWFDTKLFVNDYWSIIIFFLVLMTIIGIPIFAIKKRRKKTSAILDKC